MGREKMFTTLSGPMTLEQRETEGALSRLWLTEPPFRLPCTPPPGYSYSFRHCCANWEKANYLGRAVENLEKGALSWHLRCMVWQVAGGQALLAPLAECLCAVHTLPSCTRQPCLNTESTSLTTEMYTPFGFGCFPLWSVLVKHCQFLFFQLLFLPWTIPNPDILLH